MPDQLCTRAPPRDMSGPKRPLTGAVSHERLLYCAAKRYSRMRSLLGLSAARFQGHELHLDGPGPLTVSTHSKAAGTSSTVPDRRSCTLQAVRGDALTRGRKNGQRSKNNASLP